MNLLTLSIIATLAFDRSEGFGRIMNHSIRPKTFLNLEDHIAEMVDLEFYRENHKEEYNKQRETKKKVDDFLPVGFEFSEDWNDPKDLRQLVRDKKLADKNPQKYCADRCVATGSCEVYEDIFKMSPKQVMEFCTECVLDSSEEPCDIPESFYEEIELDDDLVP